MAATVLLAALVASSLAAQTPASPQAVPQEGRVHAELRREKERVGGSCGAFFSAKGAMGCVIALATEHPIHFAVGSLAPDNGLGMGGAFVYEFPTPTLTTDWNTDAVRSIDGAWRAGTYLNFVRTNVEMPGLAGSTSSGTSDIHPYPMFGAYVQTTSLPRLLFLGEPNSGRGTTAFAMRETVVGGNALVPIVAAGPWHLAVSGEVNGRFVAVSGTTFDQNPDINSLYDPTSAPGLDSQPATIQFGEGLRLTPSVFGDRLRLDYAVNLQEFVAPSHATASFRRLRVDLEHDIPWRGMTGGPSAATTNGPDQCATGISTEDCPALSNNQYGAIHLGIRFIKSFVGTGSAVPFYFQPTLGGTDIDGTAGLMAFGDYAFRGTDLVLFRASLEHSLGWGPLGGLVEAAAGTVGSAAVPLSLSRLHQSYGAGLTLRAGGFPMITAEYAWSHEAGHRIVVSLNSSLLGGGGRPSSY